MDPGFMSLQNTLAGMTTQSAHLEPASIEEELQQSGERHIHVQVPQRWPRVLAWLQRFGSPCLWLHKLAANQGEGKEGVYCYGHHLEKGSLAEGTGEMLSLSLRACGGG